MKFNINDITLKNFFSVGQVEQTVYLNQNTTKLILGSNIDNEDKTSNGIGKAQPYHSLIRVPNGWKTMKDINIGDVVCTPFGTHSIVTGKFPQPKKNIFEVVTNDGRKVEACDEHLWEIVHENGSVEILNTDQIKSYIASNNPIYIKTPEEIYDHENTVQHIHPYLMGCILARGKLDGDDVKFKNIDSRIIERIRKSTNNIIVNQKGLDTVLKTRSKTNSLKSLLKEMNIIVNGYKTIPNQYLHGSTLQRTELLRGFFDSIAEKNDSFSSIFLPSKDKKLSIDLQELIRSLGGVSYLKYSVYSVNDYSHSFMDSQKDIIIDSKFRNNNSFFTLDEKKDYLLCHDVYCKIESIEYKGKEKAACIKINDKRELYITNNYTITHNTTIINGISYALYGKPVTKIRKQDNIVNNKNKKNMMVSINFELNGVKYRIDRGRKPNVLNFVQYNENDEEMDLLKSLGENADTQEVIQNKILISEVVFKQIVLMNTYTGSFMDAQAAQQRQIIEEILGIIVLSEKAKTVAEKIKTLKQEHEKEKVRVETIIESNNRIQKNIEQLTVKKDNWDKEHNKKIEELQSSLEKLNEIDIKTEIENHEYNKDLDDTLEKIRYIEEQVNTKNQLKKKSENILKQYNDQLQSFTKSICPECNQTIEDGEIEKHIQEVENKISEVLDEVDGYQKTIDEYNEILTQVDDYRNASKKETFYRDIKDAYNHETMIQSIKDNINQLEQQINPYDSQIDDLQNGELGYQEIDYTQLTQYEKELKHAKFLQKLLTSRDSFVRKRIIDQSLPFLNKRLPLYLDKLALDHEITFDADLTFTIRDMGEEVDFGNLSRGEQNRAIIALNLAFRDLYENLVGPINLVFVDELLDFGIDSSAAIRGVELLKSINAEKNKSVFLITHKEELIEYVEDILYVKKENGFTSFESG
ncbi:hypothetical protein PBI_SCTP2_539 [Salicola phage SCTP-2]|nr:hypothetical protein PBI_SCTP2_539 [Salicola phage SCTP-2]